MENKTPEQLAEEWVYETNGHKWSNNNDEAGDNYGSFLAGYNARQAEVDDLNNQLAAKEKEIVEFATWVMNNARNLDWLTPEEMIEKFRNSQHEDSI